MSKPMIDIREIYGECPVQAEGFVDGEPFYFRSRGARWSMEIGSWRYEEPYQVWPEAGFITNDEAKGFISKAATAWQEFKRK